MVPCVLGFTVSNLYMSNKILFLNYVVSTASARSPHHFRGVGFRRSVTSQSFLTRGRGWKERRPITVLRKKERLVFGRTHVSWGVFVPRGLLHSQPEKYRTTGVVIQDRYLIGDHVLGKAQRWFWSTLELVSSESDNSYLIPLFCHVRCGFESTLSDT